MGALFVIREPDLGRRDAMRARVEQALHEQGLIQARRLDAGPCVAGVYQKRCGASAQLYETDNGDFACVAGTAVAGRCAGPGAAERLYREIDETAPDWSRLGGSFCALVRRGERLTLFTDRLGTCKLYSDPAQAVFSTSFLAAAAAASRLSGNAQGIYEYVHQEATYGTDTVLEQVQLADADGRYELTPSPRFERWPTPDLATSAAAPHEHVEACLGMLRRQYDAIAESFGDAVDTALSGGYDSRLTLALLLDRGVRPSLHVYGRDSDPDVQVARRIADGEGFALRHVDKSRYPRVEPDQFAAVVDRNLLAFDGYPPAGIFDSGVDLATRLDRAAGGTLMLNGGGGEIFRNFFYLPDGEFSARAVVHAFYNRYNPDWCSERFCEERYLDALAAKIQDCVARRAGTLSRCEVEYLYPAFRCRYWMGRNNSVNNRLGWSLTPFIDYELVLRAAGIPIALKNHGRLEARMISAVSPALAAYPSDYGHAFDEPVPVSRVINERLTQARPTWLRRYTYRIRFRRPLPRPRYLETRYLDAVVDRRFPSLSAYYRVERVNDPAALARLCNLEVLFARLGVSVD